MIIRYGGGGSWQNPPDGDRSPGTNKGHRDYWVVKLNEQGDVVNDYGYGGTGNDAPQAFIPVPAGGGLIAGYTLSEASGDISQAKRGYLDCWAVRFDNQGQILWEKRFGSGGSENGHWVAAAPAADGGFLLAATSAGPVGFEQRHPPLNPVSNLLGMDLWLLRLNANGDTVWTKRYGGNYTDWPWTVKPMPQGGWIVGGYTNSLQGHDISQPPKLWTSSPAFPYPTLDAWLVRLDDQGDILWERRYGGISDEQFYCLIPLADGSVLAGGKSTSFGADGGDRTAPFGDGQSGWLVHIDAQGNVLKDWAFGAPPGFTTDIRDMLALPQGGLLLCCNTRDGTGTDKSEPSRGGNDVWIVQLDASFNVVWEKTLGGSLDDYVIGAVNGGNGEVYLGGATRSPEEPSNPQSERRSPFRGDMDLWFIKLAPEQPFALHDTDIKGQRLERSAQITFAPQPVEVVDVLVERTQDLSSRPVRFETIAQVETGQVCGTAECQWLDRDPLPGSNFYRLAYRLTDGSRVYSNIVQLTFESHQSPEVIDFRIYPNPTQGPIHLDFQSRIAGQAHLELFSTDGRAVHAQTMYLERGANAFDLELDLPMGVYLMRLNLPDGTTVRERMLVR